MSLPTSDTLVILSAIVLAVVIFKQSTKRSRPPYPPGPRRLPLLGNLLNFPSKFEWLTYEKWCKELGM